MIFPGHDNHNSKNINYKVFFKKENLFKYTHSWYFPCGKIYYSKYQNQNQNQNQNDDESEEQKQNFDSDERFCKVWKL